MPLHHAVLALLSDRPARGYRDDFFLKIMAAVRSADPATLDAVLSGQRAHLLRQLHALAGARAAASTAVSEHSASGPASRRSAAS